MFLTKFQCDEKGPSFTHKFNFAAFWHGVKNVEEPSLCPASALPPPSFLLSIGSAQLVKQTKKILMWFSGEGGSSPFGSEISHVHAGLRTHFDQEPETMQMLHPFILELSRIRTKPEAFLEKDQEADLSWKRMTTTIYWDLLHPLPHLILPMAIGGVFWHHLHPTVKAQRG